MQSLFTQHSKMNSSKVLIESKEFLYGNSQKMYDMMQKQQYCDFDIVVNTERTSLHKIVMIAASEYFQNYEWDSESQRPLIRLGNYKTEAVQWIISFCYTGNIELDETYIIDVISLSSYLRIDKLLEIGFDYLLKHINISTCLETMKLANLHDKLDVKNAAFDFICQNFLKVIKTDQFLQINHELITEILKSNDINIDREEQVFNALKSWISYDQTERLKYRNSLLTQIKLNQLSLGFLFGDAQSFCSDNSECTSLIINAIREKTISKSSTTTEPRNSIFRALIVGGRDSNHALNIEIYNPYSNTWNVLFDLNLGISLGSFSAVTNNNQLILTGGFTTTAQNTVFSVDLKEKTIKNLPSMLSIRSEARSIILNNYLYVLGGFDGSKQLDSVERFDLNKNTWEYVSSLSSKRVGFGVCIYNNRIYIAGGHSDDNIHDKLEVYSPTLNRWSMLKSMNKKRNYIELIACKGKLYAIGGSDTRLFYENIIYDDIEVYDPATDNWIVVNNFPSPRVAVGACAINNKIIIYGGRNKNGIVTETCVYDVDKNDLKTNTHSGRIHPIVLPVAISDFM